MYVEIGSFSSGYVRRMNHCYTPYQLNKCKPNTEYYPERKWIKDNEGEWSHQIKTGKYIKFVGKQRIVIPDERDRLEYLIDYAIKNYYIGYANQVADGKYVDRWRHEWELKQKEKEFNGVRDVSITIDGMKYKVI